MEGGDNQYLSHPLFLQDKFSTGVPGGQKKRESFLPQALGRRLVHQQLRCLSK